MTQTRVLVTGAGGFIGNHLAKYLVDRGYWVRGVDVKLPEYGSSPAHEFELLDLKSEQNCLRATADVDEVYALAANMGGIGSSRSGRLKLAMSTTSNSASVRFRAMSYAHLATASAFRPGRVLPMMMATFSMNSLLR